MCTVNINIGMPVLRLWIFRYLCRSADEEQDFNQQPKLRKEFQTPSVLGVGEKMNILNILEKMSTFWYHKQSCWVLHPLEVFEYSCLLLTVLVILCGNQGTYRPYATQPFT